MSNDEEKVTLTLYAEEETTGTPQKLEGSIHIRAFYHAVDKGEVPPQETLQFIAHALKQIDQEKANPKQALKLAGKQGRPTDYEKELANAVKVRRLILDDWGEDKAILEIAKAEKHFKTFKRHYKRHKKEAGWIIMQEALNKDYRHIFTGGVKGVIKKKI